MKLESISRAMLGPFGGLLAAGVVFATLWAFSLLPLAYVGILSLQAYVGWLGLCLLLEKDISAGLGSAAPGVRITLGGIPALICAVALFVAGTNVGFWPALIVSVPNALIGIGYLQTVVSDLFRAAICAGIAVLSISVFVLTAVSLHLLPGALFCVFASGFAARGLGLRSFGQLK
jgi:hypothetical protein